MRTDVTISDLQAYGKAQARREKRRLRETLAADKELDELLIRAKHGALSSGEIADALSAGYRGRPRQGELQAHVQRWTTRAVTLLTAEAESITSNSLDRLLDDIA